MGAANGQDIAGMVVTLVAAAGVIFGLIRYKLNRK